MSDLRLRSYHEFNGAVFRKEAGWEVPAGYGSLDREVDAVRRATGMVDYSDHAKVRVRGADRLTFLDGLVTADIKILRPGFSAYALVLDEASRVLGDLRITALEDAFVLDIEAPQKDGLLAYLRKQIVSDDVTLEDLGFCGHIEVHGPLAPRAVSAVLGLDVQGLSVDEQTTFPLGRHGMGYASRLSTFGESGYALWAVGEGLEMIWDGLSRGGAVPIGRDAIDVLRIEAGRPQFGTDMSQETLAIEVAPEGAISPSKGCYRGQEVVARALSIGQMNRRLVGLVIDGDLPPSTGDKIAAGGEPIGSVTSGSWSPTTGWIIALALLRMDRIAPRTQIFIDHDGWDLRASVHPLPFVYGRS
jgi:folate-binding protein YgfZ